MYGKGKLGGHPGRAAVEGEPSSSLRFFPSDSDWLHLSILSCGCRYRYSGDVAVVSLKTQHLPQEPLRSTHPRGYSQLLGLPFARWGTGCLLSEVSWMDFLSKVFLHLCAKSAKHLEHCFISVLYSKVLFYFYVFPTWSSVGIILELKNAKSIAHR